MARLFLLTALGLLLTLHVASSSKVLVCHMTNWAQYRPGGARFTPEHVDPFLCTHVVYALATINSYNQISPIEWNDEQQYKSLNNHKTHNPDLKTLLSVGGLVYGVSPFIAMVSTPQNRQAFITSAISYLRHHNFDGLNLDWQFPGHNGSPATDKMKFTDLVQELAKAFADEARDTRRTRLLLMANVAGACPTINLAYEVDQIAPHLDYMNVLTYDFHGHWDRWTGHNSPLYSNDHLNINMSLSCWLERRAPAGKLLLGIPMYGRTFRLSTSDNGLGAPANGPADAGTYTRTPGFWASYEVCTFLSIATIGWIPEQEVPYATYGNAWVGYDDKRSCAGKVQYMFNQNLGGVHVWTLDMDDFSGTLCSDKSYPLINYIRTAMGFGPKPTAPEPPPPAFCVGKPDGLYANPADRTTYYQCSLGHTYLLRCQPGLIFWDSCKCCNWP